MVHDRRTLRSVKIQETFDSDHGGLIETTRDDGQEFAEAFPELMYHSFIDYYFIDIIIDCK